MMKRKLLLNPPAIQKSFKNPPGAGVDSTWNI